MPIQTHGYLIARSQHNIPQMIRGTPEKPYAVNASDLHEITVFPNEQAADKIQQRLNGRSDLHVMRCSITMEVLPL